MTNDVDGVFYPYAWSINAYIDESVLDKYPELEFISNDDMYFDEKEGREFIQRIVKTTEKDSDILIQKLNEWRETLQKEFPYCDIVMDVIHISYDYDNPMTVDIW